MTGGTALARGLGGLAGAPGRPGCVYVVLVPPDVTQLSLRGALLLASADMVVTDMPTGHPAFGLATDATITSQPVGRAMDPGDYMVVRAVQASSAAEVPGLVDELADLDRAGIPFEIEPAQRAAGLPAVLTAWRDRLPLHGRRVLVPRSRGQASALSMHIRSLGGQPIEAPVIRIADGDLGHLDEAVQDVADGAFKAIFLTSPNGVDAVADAIDRVGLDARIFDRVRRVACVGPGTSARLHDRLGIRPDFVPDEFTTEALGRQMPAGTGHVLLPRADIATTALPDALVHLGYDPVEVAAYRTAPVGHLEDDVLAMLSAGEIDLLAFASSSTVRSFVELMDERAWSGRVVSIGPVTTSTAVELGLTVEVQAQPHDLVGLVDALCVAARA